jgi:hypothetical protein
MTVDVISGAIVTQFNKKFHDPEAPAVVKVWVLASEQCDADSQTHLHPLHFIAKLVGCNECVGVITRNDHLAAKTKKHLRLSGMMR